MSKRLVITLAGLSAFAVGAAEAPLVGDPQAGAGKASTCAACHGLDGNSPAAEWPKLAGQHEDYVARHTKLVRDGGREVITMLPFVQGLSDQDIADISAHFAVQKVLPGVADDSPIAGRSDTYAGLGQQLYRAGKLAAGVPACMACHGPTGRGIPASGFPALAGQHAAYTAARLRFFHDGGQYGEGDEDPSTIMVTIAQRLAPAEIDALATYIEGLHRYDPQAAAQAEAAPAAAPAVPAAPPPEAEATPDAGEPADDTVTPDSGT